MIKSLEVNKIEYVHSMADSLDDLQTSKGRHTTILEQPNIPDEIMQVMEDERIFQLQGDYGNPDLGDPIEVDHLLIETDRGLHELRVFNRGIMLLMTNDDTFRRLHRFFVALDRLRKK